MNSAVEPTVLRSAPDCLTSILRPYRSSRIDTNSIWPTEARPISVLKESLSLIFSTGISTKSSSTRIFFRSVRICSMLGSIIWCFLSIRGGQRLPRRPRRFRLLRKRFAGRVQDSAFVIIMVLFLESKFTRDQVRRHFLKAKSPQLRGELLPPGVPGPDRGADGFVPLVFNLHHPHLLHARVRRKALLDQGRVDQAPAHLELAG